MAVAPPHPAARPRRPRRAPLALAAALAALAAAAPLWRVGAALRTHGVDVPFWDEWQLAELVLRAERGDLGAEHLWVQHNEHRLVLPRLLWLGSARLTGFDVRAGTWLSLVGAGVAVLFVGLVAVRSGRLVGGAGGAAVALAGAPLASALLVAPSAWELWSWGFAAQVVLVVLAAVATAWAVARWRGRARDTALVVACALAGALSYAAGLALLALGPAALLVAGTRGEARRATRRAHALAALALGAAIAAAYLWGYEPPASHPSLGAALERPLLAARYVLALLGSGAAAPDLARATGWGALVVAVFAGALAALWRTAPAWRPALAPWALLGAFSLASAVATAAGRVGFGAEQALAPRYQALAAPLWIAAAVLAALALVRLARAGPARLPALAALVAAAAAAATLAVQDRAAAWSDGLLRMERHAELLRHGGRALARREVASDAALAPLFEDVALVRAVADELERLRLGPFRHGPPAPPEPPEATVAGRPRGPRAARGHLDALRPDEHPGCWVATGWALEREGGRPASRVLVLVDGEPRGDAAPAAARPDVVRALEGRAAEACGFEVHVPVHGLAAGRHEVAAWAVLADGRAEPLPGLAGWELPGREDVRRGDVGPPAR